MYSDRAAGLTKPSSGPSFASAAATAAAMDAGSARSRDGERIPADCGAGGFDRIRSNVGQRDARAFGGQLLGGCAAHATGGGR